MPDLEQAPGCGCWNCDREYHGRRMYGCAACGNKRCPHGEWHGYVCTNSNEPDQPRLTYPLEP